MYNEVFSDIFVDFSPQPPILAWLPTSLLKLRVGPYSLST